MALLVARRLDARVLVEREAARPGPPAEPAPRAAVRRDLDERRRQRVLRRRTAHEPASTGARQGPRGADRAHRLAGPARVVGRRLPPRVRAGRRQRRDRRDAHRPVASPADAAARAGVGFFARGFSRGRRPPDRDRALLSGRGVDCRRRRRLDPSVRAARRARQRGRVVTGRLPAHLHAWRCARQRPAPRCKRRRAPRDATDERRPDRPVRSLLEHEPVVVAGRLARRIPLEPRGAARSGALRRASGRPGRAAPDAGPLRRPAASLVARRPAHRVPRVGRSLPRGRPGNRRQAAAPRPGAAGRKRVRRPLRLLLGRHSSDAAAAPADRVRATTPDPRRSRPRARRLRSSR